MLFIYMYILFRLRKEEKSSFFLKQSEELTRVKRRINA